MVQFGLRYNNSSILIDFRGFLEIDQSLSDATVYAHLWRLKKLIKQIENPIYNASVQELRAFLRKIKNQYKPNTYAGYIKTIRVFFRDYLNRPDLARFKFPNIPIEPKVLPTKEDLQKFYEALEHRVVKLLFLTWCNSGLRFSEVWNLKLNELDLENRMIRPSNSTSRTKRTWVSFINEETSQKLNAYLNERDGNSTRVFRISNKTFKKHWRNA